MFEVKNILLRTTQSGRLVGGDVASCGRLVGGNLASCVSGDVAMLPSVNHGK